MANTDPNHWFLPASVMDAFRTPAFTSNNKVEPLIDGKAYMDHLHARFAAMTSGDYYHFAAWRATPTHPLQPDVPGSPSYLHRLITLISSGVTVRGILWYVPASFWAAVGATSGSAAENIDMVNGINGAGPGGHAILDHRVPSYVVSHHQKSSILRSAGDHWAHVGGIDIALDRWDTGGHAHPSPPRPRGDFDAWHDVHCVIRGAAVAQVWDNFTQRWNDPTPPHSFPVIPGGAVPPPIAGAPPAPASYGSHHVQLLRTLACRGTYSFLPAGEQTARLACERAIDNAQHYIYIEEQYAWPCTLAARLNAAALRGVKIIFVLAHRLDITAFQPKHNHLRHSQFLEAVRAGGAAPNVFVFHLQQPGDGSDIYVHSKVMIVDDCYAAIGSANVNTRSQTSDSELNVAVVDHDTVPGQMGGTAVTVCRFARELRDALWQEHLGTGPIDDPIAGLSHWPSAGGWTQVHHAVVHPTPSRLARWPGIITHRIMNKRTKCP